MDKIINTHMGANGHEIKIYKDYIIHTCDWTAKENNIKHLMTIKGPKFMTKWFRKYRLIFTCRSNKPDIKLKPIGDNNSEICVFLFAGMECSPFKKLREDDFYDLTPYMKEMIIHPNLIGRIELD